MKVSITTDTTVPKLLLRYVNRRVYGDPSYVMEPTLRAASAQLAQFHATQGRGRWRRLARSTVARRERAGQRSGTPIGVQTGRLRASLVYGHPDHKVVKLSDTAWYSYPNPRVRYKGKEAGLAFLFNARRRLWPPTRGAMTDAVTDAANRVVSRRLREALQGA